jgi:hypothetical protein
MGRRGWLILLSIVSAACVLLFAGGLLSITSYNVGFYALTVELRSATPIRAVWYSNGDYDESVRRRAEAAVDRRLFDYDPASAFDGKQFTASIMWASSVSALRLVESYHHRRQLALLIEFEGGRVACKVVDIPACHGPWSIVVEVE